MGSCEFRSIRHAGLGKSAYLVSTVPEDGTAFVIASAAREINPDLPIMFGLQQKGTNYVQD